MSTFASPSVVILPWTEPFATVGSWTRTQSSAHLGGGTMTGPSTIDNSISFRVALGAGTYTITAIGSQNATYGISTVALNGVSVGTLDWYAAGGSANNVKTITSVAVTVPGVYTLSFTAATKNASSGNYAQILNLLALHRTDDASGYLNGATLPHRFDIIAWAGTQYASVSSWGPSQSSGYLGGGIYLSPTTVDNSATWLVPLASGTWSVTAIATTNTDAAISTVKLNTTTVGTLDWYAALANNAVQTITGISVTVPGIYKLSLTAATKNGSSSAYRQRLNHLILQRTGA